MSALTLSYYGYVFDASGYGHAARGYIHALHAAGVDLNVVELARRARQVRDPLVESLVQRRQGTDLHLFHGIPPEWARLAFPLRNAVGMTVWETDMMPTQWRSVLSHVQEVWLPCRYNAEVFQEAIVTPVFTLPHVVHGWDDGGSPAVQPSPVGASDFVVFSMFEWQQRKNPDGMLEAFLRAFGGRDDAVFVLKTNPGASAAAHHALAEARSRTGSGARVLLHAEAWTPAQIRAMQARTDCYLSLHRGEGWGYPLFEAAARGTPVVATAYSGPLDYLGDDRHALVRHSMARVAQRYAYYHPRMQWAEPDVGHAAELLRWGYEHQAESRVSAAARRERIAQDFSIERVGGMARDRLHEIRDRLAPSRRRRSAALELVPDDPAPGAVEGRQPPIPIPGAWYDADYFEHGLKSNWRHGYTWRQFGGLFRETAAFLVDVIPDARTYLDAGCAKGFLVQALRERGLDAEGFDGSRWAVEHADPGVRASIQLADVGEFEFRRDYDVLVAFDLLSHLTEEQATAFLRRARAHVRIALVATIASPVTPPAGADRDLTHVTRQDRDWWAGLLEATGWRQDALHRVVQGMVQRHVLPQRMGWEMYVYSPASADGAGALREAIA